MRLIKTDALAAICDAPAAAVIAAARILGHQQIADSLAFSQKPGVDFVREVEYHAGMLRNQEARQTRRESREKTIYPNPPSPESDGATQTHGV